LNDEFIDKLVKDSKIKQEKLVNTISQELTELDEDALTALLQKLSKSLENLPEEEAKNQKKIGYLLEIIKKSRQILEENKEKTEAQKFLQEIEEKKLFSFSSKENLPKLEKNIDQLK